MIRYSMIRYLYGDRYVDRDTGYLINTCIGESFDTPIQCINVCTKNNKLHKMIFNIGTFNKGYVEAIIR